MSRLITLYTHVMVLYIKIFTPIVSFIMEVVDLVIVGAEGVAESGGVINKVNERSH